MSHFISWTEFEEMVIFLTDEMVYSTRDGKKLIGYIGEDCGDIVGHGSLCMYYGIHPNKVDHLENTDFSYPDLFPEKIRNAIKEGKLKKLSRFSSISELIKLLDNKRFISKRYSAQSVIQDKIRALTPRQAARMLRFKKGTPKEIKEKMRAGIIRIFGNKTKSSSYIGYPSGHYSIGGSFCWDKTDEMVYFWSENLPKYVKEDLTFPDEKKQKTIKEPEIITDIDRIWELFEDVNNRADCWK